MHAEYKYSSLKEAEFLAFLRELGSYCVDKGLSFPSSIKLNTNSLIDWLNICSDVRYTFPEIAVNTEPLTLCSPGVRVRVDIDHSLPDKTIQVF